MTAMATKQTGLQKYLVYTLLKVLQKGPQRISLGEESVLHFMLVMAVCHISFLCFDEASSPLASVQTENYKRKMYCYGINII